MLRGLGEGALHLVVRLRSLPLLVGDELGVVALQLLGPPQVAPRLFHVRPRLGRRRLRLRHRGSRLLHRRLEGGGVDPEEGVPLLDSVALLHPQLDDPARDVRLDIDGASRPDPPAGGDRRHEVPLLDLLRADFDPALAPARDGEDDEEEDRCADSGGDPDLLLFRHLCRFLPGFLFRRYRSRGRPTAASSAASALWNA